MTETKERSIAEMIREAERPRGEFFDLAEQAARLGRSVQVAEKWIEAAAKIDMQGAMCERAETIHDELEEELSRVVWEMQASTASRREGFFNDERPDERRVEDPEAVGRAAALSESLVEAYNILAGIPQEHLGLCGNEASERTRYKLMGALLEAREAADAELKKLDPNAYV
jgi:hypothetical protein